MHLACLPMTLAVGGLVMSLTGRGHCSDFYRSYPFAVVVAKVKFIFQIIPQEAYCIWLVAAQVCVEIDFERKCGRVLSSPLRRVECLLLSTSRTLAVGLFLFEGLPLAVSFTLFRRSVQDSKMTTLPLVSSAARMRFWLPLWLHGLISCPLSLIERGSC